jgi:hypothetical protein
MNVSAEDVPAAGPKFVTPAEEAEALGFFVVASTLGLVSADCQLVRVMDNEEFSLLVVLIKRCSVVGSVCMSLKKGRLIVYKAIFSLFYSRHDSVQVLQRRNQFY